MDYQQLQGWRDRGSLFRRVRGVSSTFNIELTGSLLAQCGGKDDDFLGVYFEVQVMRRLEIGEAAVTKVTLSSGGRTVVEYTDGQTKRLDIDLPP